MKRTLWTTLLAALCSSPSLAQDPVAPVAPVAIDAEVSCRVCHPGATRGLARSPHAILNERQELRGQVCASCHGDLTAHATALGRNLPDRPAVHAVTAASCASCHPGQDLQPSRGTHRLATVGSGAPPLPAPDADRLAVLEAGETDASIDWSGFAELGYRFVHHQGSRSAFRSDLDLQPRALLRAFELRGTGSAAAAFDEFTVHGRDLGDPRWDAGASLRKADRFDVDSRYRRANYRYEASGDYHRVDRDSRDWTTSVSGGTETWQVFGSYTNREQDGFWLTQRIGNQNLPVQGVIDGVNSPRHFVADEGELGVRGELGALRWTIAGGYVDERAADRWSYSQPATANPGFTESEDLSTVTRLDGPTGRISVAHDGGPVSFELSGLVRDVHRTLATNGTGSGFDTTAFTTATTANGRGRGRLMQWQIDGAFAMTETLRLLATARYRDYREHLRLQQASIRTTSSPTSVVTTNTTLDDETVQRLFDGDLSLLWDPSEDFDVAVGYGIAREQLRVLSPGTADPQDFRRGHLDDDGFLAHLRWRFAEEWTVRAEGRDFASDGVRLHELTEQRARQAKATIEWKRDPAQIAVFARHRHAANDVSSHRLSAFATGISGSATTDGVSLQAGYTFADTESRTRTNFYFDPDPSPRPTLVGFTGETHTANLMLVLTPHDQLQAELGAAMTRTNGSFAVDTADLHAGMRWRCTENGAAGIEWRHVRYDDQDGVDDWSADLVFVFWRQEW